jgi:hypothetical protein
MVLHVSQKTGEAAMKSLMVFLVLLLFPLTAIAGEKVKGTTYFVVNQQGWKTGDGTGYWIWHGDGVSQSVEGPLGTGPSECHGAGFWDENGSWGEGICVHGDGDDTRTVHWKRDKGQKVGQWTNLLGTGKFAGITGGGSYTTTSLPGNRHISEWDGEVTLAE